MFGEYALYYHQKITALVFDDRLFVKPTFEEKAFIGDYHKAIPYPSANSHLLISEDLWEDGEWLSKFVRITAEAMLLKEK